MAGLLLVFGHIFVCLEGNKIFSRDIDDLGSSFYFLRNYTAFCYLLSWTLWVSVFYWIFLLYRNRTTDIDLWPILEGTFWSALVLFFAVSLSFQFISLFFSPNDFKDFSFGPIVTLVLVCFIILFLFFFLLKTLKSKKQALKKIPIIAWRTAFKCFAIVFPILLIGLAVFLGILGSGRYLSFFICFLILVLLPAFCAGPYTLLSYLSNKHPDKDIPSPYILFVPHCISLFIFFIPISYEVTYAVFFR